MSNDQYGEALVADNRIALWSTSMGICSGFMVGGGEAIVVIHELRLMMSNSELWALAFAALPLMGLLGGALGAFTGLIAQLLMRRARRITRYRMAFSLMMAGLSWFYIVPFGWEVLHQEQSQRAWAILALGLSLPMTMWYNAGYWLRRQLIGAGPAVGWRGISTALGVFLAVLAPLSYTIPPVSSEPVADSPNIILITIDTLRRDHVGAYGGLVATPNIDRLAAEGILFEDALTPFPETAPSHASMFVGRHPVETRMLSNGSHLSIARQTLAEHLSLQGYRTGAFVSAFAVDAGTGLDQGFQVYDDNFFPMLRGVAKLRLAHLGLRVLMRFGDPADYPSLLERPAPDTLARALSWVPTRTGPFFMWVHLFDVHSPYQRHDGAPQLDHKAILAQEPGYAYSDKEKEELKMLYRMEVEYVDTQIGIFVDELKKSGALDNAVLMLSADHGESLGEHEVFFNHHGLYDEVLRVPMIYWASKPNFTPGLRVGGQVSVMDIPNTLLNGSGQLLMSNTRSENLLNRTRGVLVPLSPLLLVGREGLSLSEGWMYGVRSNNIKYIQHADGTEGFFDLDVDPQERNNMAATQPAGVQVGRNNVDGLKRLMPDAPPAVDDETQQRLRSMGYLE